MHRYGADRENGCVANRVLQAILKKSRLIVLFATASHIFKKSVKSISLDRTPSTGYLKYTRSRKHTAKTTRKAIGKQLSYLRRDLETIDVMLSCGKLLNTIRTIYEQQKYMYDNHTHTIPDRIVSVSQPFVRPIMRGKAGKPVEFGAKLDISVVDGWTRLEFCSLDAYNEALNLQEMAERFRKREGHYPGRILADKIYRNRENLAYCKECGIRLSGPDSDVRERTRSETERRITETNVTV